MITALLFLSCQRASEDEILDANAFAALNAHKQFSPNAISQKFKRGTLGSSPYDSTEFDFGNFVCRINNRTREVVIAGGRSGSSNDKPIDSDQAAVERAREIAKLLRPKMIDQLTFKTIPYAGCFGVGVGRTIDGVQMPENGDSRFILFDREKGFFQGFRLPPSEAGIHKIDQWLPVSKASSTAVRFALSNLRRSSQLNLDSFQKTYVGENWFSGMPNPKHRAFSDPGLKGCLFPAYVGRYIDADSIRPSDQAPFLFIDVYIDAEDNTVFGYTIWAAGGIASPSVNTLDGETFYTIKILERADVPVKLTLTRMETSGRPAGISAVIFSTTKAAKVLVDRQYHVVWRGNTPYGANEEFWRAVSK